MFKKVSLIFLVLFFILSSTAGCSGQKEQVGQVNNGETKPKGNLKLAGSTSVQPLAEELAMRFMELNREVKIDVTGGGSGAGVESTINGAADIGMTSRELKESEKENNPGLKTVVIAQDGIAVIVNKNNIVDDLTLEQVKDIFSGKITNWKDLGGKDTAITVVNREEGSGTRGAFEEIVLGKEKITEKAAVQNSTGAVKTAVSADPNAIGYISMGSMDDEVKSLKIGGIEPSIENAKSGFYPVTRPFIFLVNGEAEGLAKVFIDWVLDTEAQEMVQENGFIPVK
ncbi:MAG: phosphate ABC transporter substrate-binding protein [Clostridia bacterium]|nr:phosphate ABC transporter substrate-binding protein [Clostridia bacterium]